MKTTPVVAVCFVALIFCVSGLSLKVHAAEYFITYGNASRQEEKVFLKNFAIELNRDGATLAYIGIVADEKEKSSETRARIKRIKTFLTRNLKIDPARIVIKELGKKGRKLTILQPWPKSNQPPF